MEVTNQITPCTVKSFVVIKHLNGVILCNLFRIFPVLLTSDFLNKSLLSLKALLPVKRKFEFE